MRIFFAAVVAVPLLAGVASSQEPASPSDAIKTQSEDVSMTPEMWFYEQEIRRYEDPNLAVRRKAEYRARQRMQRIAARKWYGYSNLRPRVTPTPWGVNYTPTWVSNSGNTWGWTAHRPFVYIPDSAYSR